MNENFLENITILVVEDSKKDLELLEKVLKRYFKQVYTATDGHEAYEIYQNNKDIDIIVSDIDMPRVSGLELLRLIRMTNLYLPVIIVSGRLETEFLVEALNLNVSSFLPKPLNTKQLLEKVDILCEKKLYELKLKQKQIQVDHYLTSVDSVAIIYKMKSDGSITYMNESMRNISGYTKQELKSLSFYNIIHPTIPDKYIEDTWDKIKSGKLWKGNTKFLSKSGETFYLNNTIFKLESSEDEFITIAFLTTQENLEKRNFHKKMISTFKDYNVKEYSYKQEIKALKKKIESINVIENDYIEQIISLKSKIKSQEMQLLEYEKKLATSSEKYNNMLKMKKDELERYVNLIQIEKIQSEKFEKENKNLRNELEILIKEEDKLKETNANMHKHIKDLKEIIKGEKK